MLFIQRVTRRLVSHLSLGLETPLFLRFDDSLWLPLETLFFSFFFFNLFTVVNTPYVTPYRILNSSFDEQAYSRQLKGESSILAEAT